MRTSWTSTREPGPEFARFHGQVRDTAGDGFFATFDGPASAIRAGQAVVAGLDELGLEARIGVHVGECELLEGKLSVRDLAAGSGLTFVDRGQRELKGVAGTWQLYTASSETSGANALS